MTSAPDHPLTGVTTAYRAGQGFAAGQGTLRKPQPSLSPLTKRLMRRSRRHVETSEAFTAAGIVLAMMVSSWLIVAFPAQVPWAIYMPFVVLSGTVHSPRWHAVILGLAVSAVLLTSYAAGGVKQDAIGAALATLAVGLITLWRSASRARVGVQGNRGESMLADLRTRLVKSGRIPRLPEPWHAETCVRSAFGQRFSGDFVVARRHDDGRRLEIVLVDISGKGLDAGSRALMLSGGLVALLGSVPAGQFLTLANDYVVRQDWAEGFTTAIHLDLDLHTGEFQLNGAGHPPAAWYRAGTGDWQIMDHQGGPVLGLLPHVTYVPVSGCLRPGDALMLYTDGVIEARGGDLDQGIRRMTRQVHPERDGFAGSASRLCAQAAAGEGDDRGVVMVWREANA